MTMRLPIRILIGACLIGLANATPTLDVNAEAGGLTLAITGDPTKSQRAEFGDGYSNWTLFDALRGASAWEAPAEMAEARRLFRVVETTPPWIAAHKSWKNAIELPADPFLNQDFGASIHVVNWVKFAILLDDPSTVYFQDSQDYVFHYNFATERLAPFAGMSATEFDQVSLARDGQEVVLGAVLVEPNAKEFAVQFVGSQPYPREMLRFLYETVAAAIVRGEEWEGLIMPVTSHAVAMRAQADYFSSHGIALAEPDRWSDQGGCYVAGWAVGRLRYFDHEQIDAAYLSGDLLPTDILVTDLVPAELPFVAGILSFAPTTPNSHVAILAESYGIPFAYVDNEIARQETLALNGSIVALRTGGDFWGCNLSLLDAGGVPTGYLDEILALKAPPELAIEPKALLGAIVANNLASATPSDIRFVGGKAANFGFLRRTIPSHSPEAIAFTFDLWDAYFDQPVGEVALRAEIAARLAPHSTWPPDIAELDSVLSGVRDLIKDSTDFDAAHRAAVLAALSGFDPMKKLRFRSSTNVEDSGVFVGAGLYDSYSGCVADDTDADEDGPSHCDPDQPKERGVFRAMRKVYASFYNLNAYLERLRHGVDESEVGMALLVHHSFPDEIEAANGVATLERRLLSGSTSIEANMVTQVGANSVTNPEGDAIPEVARTLIYRGNFNFESANMVQASSLLRLGEESVMVWQDDYLSFGQFFFDLAEAFVEEFPAKPRPRLEFEYKKLTDGSLIIKQMREIPAGDHTDAPGVALIGAPVTWEVFQGETGTVLGNHRLKSIWQVAGDNRWVDPESVDTSLLGTADVEHLFAGEPSTDSDLSNTWLAHSFDTFDQGQSKFTRDRWSRVTPAGASELRLEIALPTASAFVQDPMRSLGDFTIYYGASYPSPVLSFEFGANTTTEDVVLLVPGHPDTPAQDGSILKVRERIKGGVTLRTEFFWPPNPTGPIAGYTAPLEKWQQTTISGLTTEPLVLSGYYSGTYRPGHHNFTEEFVFEPALEEGLAAGQVTELEAANVRQIYWFESGSEAHAVIKLIGFDGRVRDP